MIIKHPCKQWRKHARRLIIILALLLIPVSAWAVKIIYVSDTLHVDLSDISDAGSGLGEMRFSFDNETWTAWESFSEEKEIDLTQKPDGQICLYVEVRDKAGNVGKITTSSGCVIKDTTAPDGTVVIIGVVIEIKFPAP